MDSKNLGSTYYGSDRTTVNSKYSPTYSNQLDDYVNVHEISSKRSPTKQTNRSNTYNNINAKAYPLVQALQFDADQYKSSQPHVGFYENKNEVGKVERGKYTENKSVQTVGPPPLQYESNKTNLFNCCDNLANGNFNQKDLTDYNDWITPKRELEEFEVLRKMARK